MNEYFVSVNGNNILMCKDTDEAVIFDSFGGFIRKCSYREGLSICGVGYVSEVCLCSISGKSSTDLEVYYNGKRKKISGVHSLVFKNIQNLCSGRLVTHVPFRLKGEDDIPITILVFQGDVSLETFASQSKIGGPQGWLEV